VLSYPQFIFGRVVEDIKGNLVTDARPHEEVIGDNPRQNLVQSFGQRFAHGDTCMQRSTYFLFRLVR